MPGEIPIGDARKISRERNQPVVIIFGLSGATKGESFNVTTYGATKALCRYAADIGQKFADAVLNGVVTPAKIAEDAPDVNAPMLWNGASKDRPDFSSDTNLV